MPAPRLARFALVAFGIAATVPYVVHAGGVQIGSLVIVDDDDCTLKMRIRDDGSTWKIQADGCFEVDDHETDIVKIPAGGYFRAEERRGGRTRHWIEIRSTGNGEALTRKYERDGREVPFDAEARTWMARALDTVFGHTDFGHSAHIERVLARDGIDGALREVAEVDSDYQMRKSYERLIELRPGDPELLTRAVRDAEGRIDSSYEMAELLVAVAENAAATTPALEAAAHAAETIDSDYERRKALLAIVHARARDRSVIATVLQGCAKFDSDHERGELLRSIAAEWTLEGAIAQSYFDAVTDMDSDYERARALKAVLERGPLPSDVAQGLAAAAAEIDSDYHKAEVLEELAGQPMDEATRAACERAARTIDSDYHRGRTMDALHAQGS